MKWKCSFCSNIELKAPFNMEEGKRELHFTYLDTVGRPVVVAHKTNLVEQHIQDFEVCTVKMEENKTIVKIRYWPTGMVWLYCYILCMSEPIFFFVICLLEESLWFNLRNSKCMYWWCSSTAILTSFWRLRHLLWFWWEESLKSNND